MALGTDFNPNAYCMSMVSISVYTCILTIHLISPPPLSLSLSLSLCDLSTTASDNALGVRQPAPQHARGSGSLHHQRSSCSRPVRQLRVTGDWQDGRHGGPQNSKVCSMRLLCVRLPSIQSLTSITNYSFQLGAPGVSAGLPGPGHSLCHQGWPHRPWKLTSLHVTVCS